MKENWNIVQCVTDLNDEGYGMMNKYYKNAEDNAAFDRCIDVMSKMILKYGNKVLENKTLGELLEEEQKAA